MITNIDFFKDAEKENDKKYVEDITKKLIEKDDELFKITKENPEYQKYKIKEKRNKTIITKRCLVTIPRRRYYYFDEILKRKVYVFLLDEYLGIKKWQRTENSLREKILSFMGDGKRYSDVIDTVADSKISNMTISNIYKNVDLDKIDYIHINQSNKIDITGDTIYVQADGTFQTMRDDKTKEKLKEHILISSIHTGFDKEKSTEKRPVIENKKGVFEMNNIPHKIKNLTNIKVFTNKVIEAMYSYNIKKDTKILVLGDDANYIETIANAIAKEFKYNILDVSLDKYHLVKKFEHLWSYRKRNKMQEIKYNIAKHYFYNGKYDELLDLLNSLLPYIVGNKRSYLLKTIKYIKNNEKGIRNQILPNNIGCHMEGDISKAKSIKGRGGKIYNKLTFNNLLIASMIKTNSETNMKNNKEIKNIVINKNNLVEVLKVQNLSI